MIGWLVFVGYLLAGLVMARAMHTRWYRLGWELDTGSVVGAICVGLVWPGTLLYLVVARWITAPVERDMARLEQLRADRETWRVRTYSSDPEEQRMATEIVRVLDDALKAEGRW